MICRSSFWVCTYASINGRLLSLLLLLLFGARKDITYLCCSLVLTQALLYGVQILHKIYKKYNYVLCIKYSFQVGPFSISYAWLALKICLLRFLFTFLLNFSFTLSLFALLWALFAGSLIFTLLIKTFSIAVF